MFLEVPSTKRTEATANIAIEEASQKLLALNDRDTFSVISAVPFWSVGENLSFGRTMPAHMWKIHMAPTAGLLNQPVSTTDRGEFPGITVEGAMPYNRDFGAVSGWWMVVFELA